MSAADPSVPKRSGDPLIDVQNIFKTYGEGTENPVHALRGVSFSLSRGEFASIMGTSGSGKSTMMNILGCLDKPSSGVFMLNGRNIASETRRGLARLRSRFLGFVFQNFQLLPRLSAQENVEMPLQYRSDISGRERAQRAKDALVRVGLADKLFRRPTELSGGQQQRVAIARALANRPEVLLADEPTGNLDTRTGLDVLSLLQDLNRDGLTIIVVTHESDVAACTARRLLLRDGKLVSDTVLPPLSAHDELKKLPVETNV
jgi:putative ABC transport system ATP-binding protein